MVEASCSSSLPGTRDCRRKGTTHVPRHTPLVPGMTAIVVASLLLLLLIIVIVGVVVVGLEGHGGARLPRLATKLGRAARHLNGDGTPPPAFLRLLRRLYVDASDGPAGDRRGRPAHQLSTERRP